MINTICNTTFFIYNICLILPTRYIKNPSILANQIRNDFGPVGLLHEIL